MTTSGSARRPSILLRAAPVALLAALGIALIAQPLPAYAQSTGMKSYDRVSRPGKHYGG